MSDFIRPEFRTPNIPQYSPPTKIEIRKQDLSLDFLLAREVGKNYKIEYIVNIIPSVRERDPSIPLNPLTVDMGSLKKAIIQNIDYYDRKYLDLVNFDTRKAVFYVNETFFKNAFTNINPATSFSSFRRDFRLKTRLPRVIVYDPIKGFDDFLLKKFFEYMEKKRKENTWFKHLLPEQLRRKYRSKIRNMFEWDYDPIYNKISARLKTIYILAIIYATGSMLKKIRPNDTITYNDKKLFVDKVKSNLNKFDETKYKKYIMKRGFI
jgi:hypothetical protein